MPDYLYGRALKLTLALPTPVPGDYSGLQPNAIEINGSSDPTAPGLRVKFRITKTQEKDPNPAEITVSNLADSTRRALQVKGVKVILEAGYRSAALSRLFVGDARTIDHVRTGPDWDSTIKCGDGERGFRWARYNDSFAAGTPVSVILNRCAASLGLEVGNAGSVAAQLQSTFAAGYVVSGPAQRSLDRLLRSVGLTWSIQDGRLQVLAPGAVVQHQVPLISPDTGLIGSPEMGTPEKIGQPALCKFKALLTPVQPGALVALQSQRYNGQVRVKKATFTGDTHGGDWYVAIEGVLH